jgi:hypothetical protein
MEDDAFDEMIGKENHVIKNTRSHSKFQRTDSGFNDETNSNFSYMEHFETVDENRQISSEANHHHIPEIKTPLKVLGRRLVLSKNRSLTGNNFDNHDEHFSHDVSMQSEIDFN